MLHFTCDLCGEHLEQERFVVKVEVAPAFNPEEIGEADLDADHLNDVAELLSELENSDGPRLEDASPQQLRFDLCGQCREKYLQDPLGQTARRLNFSQN